MSAGKYLLVGPLVVVCVAALTAQPPPPPSALSPVRIPIATEDCAPIVVPVTIQEKQYLFLLDTGATHTIYDRSLRSLLGQRLAKDEASTPHGKVEVECCRPPAASLGGLPLPSASALVYDLRRFREATGVEIVGVLGMDFLQHHVVEIDFDRGQLVLGPSPARRAAPGIPLTFRNSCPYLELASLGKGEELLVDTGFGGHGSLSLRSALYTTLCKAGRIQETALSSTALSIGKKVTAKTPGGCLASLSVGKLRIRDLNTTAELDRNMVGLGLLRRFRVTFDFPEEKLYLEPGKKIGQSDRTNHSGLLLLRRDGATVIEAVREGGPGAKSGLRARDVLLELNGARADRAPLSQLYNQLSTPGATVRARVRRGEKEIEATLRLSDER